MRGPCHHLTESPGEHLLHSGRGTAGLPAGETWSPSWVTQFNAYKVPSEVMFIWNCFRIILTLVPDHYQFSNFITFYTRKIPNCSMYLLPFPCPPKYVRNQNFMDIWPKLPTHLFFPPDLPILNCLIVFLWKIMT